jgi:rRNA pseudouridine-1189 N-methylase Emg1 (Nep1/Mra1 family)
VEEELGPVEAEKLANMLGESSDKERIYLEYRSALDKKSLGEELEKAAILIRALADGLCPVPASDAGPVEAPPA